jgi:hypothetical protein
VVSPAFAPLYKARLYQNWELGAPGEFPKYRKPIQIFCQMPTKKKKKKETKTRNKRNERNKKKLNERKTSQKGLENCKALYSGSTVSDFPLYTVAKD